MTLIIAGAVIGVLATVAILLLLDPEGSRAVCAVAAEDAEEEPLA